MELSVVPTRHGYDRVVEVTLLAKGGGEATVYIRGPRGGETQLFYGDAKKARREAAHLRDRARELEEAARELEANVGSGVIGCT